MSAGGRGRPARRLLRGALAAALAAMVVPGYAPVSAQPAPPAIEDAIKSSAKSDRALKAFYRANGYRPLWIRDGGLGPEADRLVELVASADLDGLDPERYRPRALAAAVDKGRSGSAKALAKAETLLSRTFAAYVRDLRRPRDIGMVYVDRELAPTQPSVRQVLAAAAGAPSLRDHLDGLRWMNPLYAGLREGLAEYRARWGRLPQGAIPPGPTLRAGAAGERVRLLRHRLGLPADGGFDAGVAAALRKFQAAHGLPDDALAGPRTLAALNADPRHRERLIRLNLERARALPADPGRRYIVVDAASARLWLYEDGRVRDTMRVIVGKPTEQTPMMAGLIRHAMVNPYWNIPPDLVRKRIALAVLDKGVSYLKAMRYEVLADWSADARVIDPKEVDWAAIAAGRLDLPVRQLPGKDNAMGKMKFMLPNQLGIYLHDTPDKALFRKEDRRFSSGCVRVEDAPRLARWLFGRPLAPRTGAPEQQVDLPEPVPVYITYLTAAPAAKGIAFEEDAYDRDQPRLAGRAP
ncbi:MAG TPA: L,D-transpeptidase family protein [Allosphingosinicella sp.]|nr:L,D-transpeptidase family protein [Allosphingosinicella sp.]